MDHYPPRWAQRFLRWYCKPRLAEDLEGDINEFFERNVKERGLFIARLIYILDVFKFLRPYTLRKPEFLNLLIHWIMFGSYLKTSARSISRNRLFSTINIIGLSVSMSVGLLVIALVNDFMSYDDFHANKDNIYRVITHDKSPQREMELASTSVRAGIRIKESVPGVEHVAVLRRGFGADATVGSQKVALSGFWADENFLSIFQFPLIAGDVRTALKEPNTIVLTETSAHKLFGSSDVVGKAIKFDTIDYVVTGVLKNIPKLSHIRFESLVSFATIAGEAPDTDGDFFGWENVYMSYVYFTLHEGTDKDNVQVAIDQICVEENRNLKDRAINLLVQPLTEAVVGKNLGNPIGPVMNSIAIYILGGLASVIIISACFNYTNLSIARALRRSREVGIRKVIGARKSHVMSQFICEAVLVAIIALAFSFVFYLILRDQFLGLTPFLADLVSLELLPGTMGMFVLLAMIVGLMAGAAPAIFFSRINAIQVLKDVSTMRVFQRVSLRKGLIVIQYTFSLVFITAAIIGYNQYRGFITFDLGFQTENILNLNLQGNNADVVKKSLQEIPEITGVAKSTMVTSLGNIWGMQVKYNNGRDSANVWLNYIDDQYLAVHEHKFVAGRNFSPKPTNDETEVIVNEQLLKEFNFSGPAQDAIGTVLEVDATKLSIAGVVRNFHYGTLEDRIQPMIFRYSNDPGVFLNVRIASTDVMATMEKISIAWKSIDPIHPLDAKFYDDQIEEAYSQFSVMVKVIGFLGFLAVVISSMGLFGMVVFTTETRMKEIGIRKVLGAGEGKLVILLSRGFLVLLLIAGIIALPLTYFFFSEVVLTNFAYHSDIGMGEILLSVSIVMCLAFVMIGTLTLKAARTNPATVLKVE